MREIRTVWVLSCSSPPPGSHRKEQLSEKHGEISLCRLRATKVSCCPSSSDKPRRVSAFPASAEGIPVTCLPFGGKRTATQILPPPELCVVRAGAVSVPSPVFTLLQGASAGQGRSSNPAPCEPWRNPQQHPSQGQGSGELLQELLNCSDLSVCAEMTLGYLALTSLDPFYIQVCPPPTLKPL